MNLCLFKDRLMGDMGSGLKLKISKLTKTLTKIIRMLRWLLLITAKVVSLQRLTQLEDFPPSEDFNKKTFWINVWNTPNLIVKISSWVPPLTLLPLSPCKMHFLWCFSQIRFNLWMVSQKESDRTLKEKTLKIMVALRCLLPRKRALRWHVPRPPWWRHREDMRLFQ